MSSPIPGAISLRAGALHFHVGAFGEDRIEMGDDGEHGRVRGALADSHDVAFAVHFDIAQTLLAQQFEVRLRATLLLERRSRDLGQRDQLANEPIVIGPDEG